MSNIVKSLRCTKNQNEDCNTCKYSAWLESEGLDYCDRERLEIDAADEIERLETENAALREQLACVTAERDTAVEDIRRCCDTCGWYRPSCGNAGTKKCARGRYAPSARMECNTWEWRGPQKEDNEK